MLTGASQAFPEPGQPHGSQPVRLFAANGCLGCVRFSSLLLCLWEYAEQAYKLQTGAAAARLRGRGGKAHFCCRTSFTEKGQVNSISLQRTWTAPQGATTGHHSCRTGHVLRPHVGGCPANPDCPCQPATGPHFAQSHVPPLTQPDGVKGWRTVGHLGAPGASPLFPACFTDSNSEN